MASRVSEGTKTSIDVVFESQRSARWQILKDIGDTMNNNQCDCTLRNECRGECKILEL
jgi:hypothetical protein